MPGSMYLTKEPRSGSEPAGAPLLYLCIALLAWLPLQRLHLPSQLGNFPLHRCQGDALPLLHIIPAVFRNDALGVAAEPYR